MSNFRALLLLVSGIVLVAVLLFTGGLSGEAIQVSGRELLDSLSDSTAVVLARADSPRIRLEKGERWEMSEPYVAQADEQQVAKLIDAFAQAPILDYMTEAELAERGRALIDFGLDDPMIVATFTLAKESSVVALGLPTPTGDGVYARIGGAAGVFVLGGALPRAADLPVDDLRRRSLFTVAAESVSDFSIRRGQESRLNFARRPDGWHLGSERASEANVRKFLNELTSAEALDFIWPTGATNEAAEASSALLAGFGLDPESAVTVTLKGVDGIDRSISLGKSAKADRVYALIQNGSSVVTVGSGLRDAAVQDVRLFTDSRLFPLDAASVGCLTIADGDALYALARGDQGTWRLESPVSVPADAEFVEQLLSKVLNLSPNDADPQGVAVSLSTNSPALRVSRAKLVGVGGFDDLRSKEVLRLDVTQVRRLVRTLKSDGGKPVSVTYARDRQAWNLEQADGGLRVSDQGVAALLAALAPLKAERIERLKVSSTDLDDYGLNAPYLVLAIDQDGAGGLRRNLIVGGRTEGGRFATIGSADAVFVLRDSAVTALESPLTE